MIKDLRDSIREPFDLRNFIDGFTLIKCDELLATKPERYNNNPPDSISGSSSPRHMYFHKLVCLGIEVVTIRKLIRSTEGNFVLRFSWTDNFYLPVNQ